MNHAVSAAAHLPLEPKGADFPYYDGVPQTIAAGGWWMVMAASVAGFAALVTPMPFADGIATGWLRAAAFVGLPLLALAMAAPGRWTAIFGRVGVREVRLMFGFALLNIIITMSVGLAIKAFGTTSGNEGITDAANLEGRRMANFFAKVAVQLLGEELISILPFLALLAFLHNKAGWSRNSAALAAWFASAVGFGLIHLPTYDWNIVQCLLAIGSARLVLTWAYIWTKNIWVSTGAHILNDWAILSSTIFLTPLATGA